LVVLVDFGVAKRSSVSSVEAAAAAPVGRALLDGGARFLAATLVRSLNEEIFSINQKIAMKLLEPY